MKNYHIWHFPCYLRQKIWTSQDFASQSSLYNIQLCLLQKLFLKAPKTFRAQKGHGKPSPAFRTSGAFRGCWKTAALLHPNTSGTPAMLLCSMPRARQEFYLCQIVIARCFVNVIVITTLTLHFNLHGEWREAASAESWLWFDNICQFSHPGCVFLVLEEDNQMRITQANIYVSFTGSRRNSSPVVDLNNFLLRNWVRLGQGVAGHWQRWDKADFQEMTALDSSSKTTSRAQMTRTAARHQDADPSLWEEVRQGHSMQVLSLFSKGLLGSLNLPRLQSKISFC